jgi:hypothetical protein
VSTFFPHGLSQRFIRAWDPEEGRMREYMIPSNVLERMEAVVATLSDEDLQKGTLCQDDEGNFYFKYDVCA